jgi:hypothetical protein
MWCHVIWQHIHDVTSYALLDSTKSNLNYKRGSYSVYVTLNFHKMWAVKWICKKLAIRKTVYILSIFLKNLKVCQVGDRQLILK